MSPVTHDDLSPHRNYLIVVAMREGLGYNDAEDAVQDLYAKLLRPDVRIVTDAEGNSRAWLAVSLRHAIRNAKREATRIKRGGGAEHVQIEPDMIACSDDPARMLELRWLRESLTAAGATEAALLPDRGTLTGAARVVLCRLRKRLQPLLVHFLPS